ncbi:MAG: FHA domain-containing protein [Kofleriaceae bacterium]|nr:FHA domain-containing protein [Kofleriaceae bacterium]
MRVVIDHIAGSRRGQRQEFPATGRVRFGRHPDCEVSFDPHRDIDASSRHAELRVATNARASTDEVSQGWVLVDLGSSNGTYVEGHRVTETPVSSNVPISVEFGPGGPRIRLFVGDDSAIESLPPAPLEPRRPKWGMAAAIGCTALALLVIALVLMQC